MTKLMKSTEVFMPGLVGLVSGVHGAPSEQRSSLNRGVFAYPADALGFFCNEDLQSQINLIALLRNDPQDGLAA
jgi:hypothetical protein